MRVKSQLIHGIGLSAIRTRRRLARRLEERGIRDQAVLEVILNTPRHLFVEEALASLAYEDVALPIGFGQTISQPFIVARMTEVLLQDPVPRRVLEIGTGSGYQTAVLSQVVGEVYSVERVAKLLARSRERLHLLGLRNVRLKHGDGSLGWPKFAPYDGILVTAAAPGVPIELLKQLAIGGKLVAPVGERNKQELMLVERGSNGFKRHLLGSVSFVPLLGGVL